MPLRIGPCQYIPLGGSQGDTLLWVGYLPFPNSLHALYSYYLHRYIYKHKHTHAPITNKQFKLASLGHHNISKTQGLSMLLKQLSAFYYLTITVDIYPHTCASGN